MSGHTPGPWWFGIADKPEMGPRPLSYTGPGYYENPAIHGADGTEVVGCSEYDAFCHGDFSEDTREANIRLIESAPLLLAELKQASAQMEMAAEAIEAGRYDEALLHVMSMSRGRKEAIAKATGTQP